MSSYHDKKMATGLSCQVRNTCGKLLAKDDIEVIEVKLKRGYHPNSRANLEKGPRSRKKTRVRKLFSLAPETVEWLQQQPLPASQAIDELVALAKHSLDSCVDWPKPGAKVQILEGPKAGCVGKVCQIGVQVSIQELTNEPPEVMANYPVSSLKPLI